MENSVCVECERGTFYEPISPDNGRRERLDCVILKCECADVPSWVHLDCATSIYSTGKFQCLREHKTMNITLRPFTSMESYEKYKDCNINCSYQRRHTLFESIEVAVKKFKTAKSVAFVLEEHFRNDLREISALNERKKHLHNACSHYRKYTPTNKSLQEIDDLEQFSVELPDFSFIPERKNTLECPICHNECSSDEILANDDLTCGCTRDIVHHTMCIYKSMTGNKARPGFIPICPMTNKPLGVCATFVELKCRINIDTKLRILEAEFLNLGKLQRRLGVVQCCTDKFNQRNNQLEALIQKTSDNKKALKCEIATLEVTSDQMKLETKLQNVGIGKYGLLSNEENPNVPSCSGTNSSRQHNKKSTKRKHRE